MAKVHYRHPAPPEGPASVALCGWIDVPTTDDVESVRCKLCVRAIAQGLHQATHAPSEDAFEPSGPYQASPGVRGLSEAAKRAVEASLRGTVAEQSHRWRSAREAIREWRVFREDGQGVGSTSAPTRFDRAPRGRSDPSRQVASQVDRVHGVDRALDLAFTAPRSFTWRRTDDVSAPLEVVEVSAGQQRAVLLWALEERVLRDNGRPTTVSVSVESVLEKARDVWGLRLSERQVELIRDAGLRAVAAHLVEIGEMRPPQRGAREEGEAVRDYDLKGWDAIEEHTGLSRAVLRRLSDPEQTPDPLPIRTLDGVKGLYAKGAELDAWFEKRAEQRKAGAA